MAGLLLGVCLDDPKEAFSLSNQINLKVKQAAEEARTDFARMGLDNWSYESKLMALLKTDDEYRVSLAYKVEFDELIKKVDGWVSYADTKFNEAPTYAKAAWSSALEEAKGIRDEVSSSELELVKSLQKQASSFALGKDQLVDNLLEVKIPTSERSSVVGPGSDPAKGLVLVQTST